MFAPGLKRHLVQRSSLVASGEKRTLHDHRKSAAFDPKRHFANADCRIAKRSICGAQNMEHTSIRLPGSLRLDARGLDHLGPLFSLVGDELAEVRRRA